MAGNNLPRQTTDGPKHLTPPAPKPKIPKPPQVREGDVVLIKDHRSSYGARPALVIRAATGRWGSYKVVDPEGRDLEIAKPVDGKVTSLSDFYGDQITIIGHDDGWLRFEKGIPAERTRYVREHSRATIVRMRQDREKGK